MPIKCYSKPNRLTPRNFTAKDAARVLCYAVQAGFTFEEVVEVSKTTGRNCIEQELAKFIEKEVAKVLCDKFGNKLTVISAKIVKVASPIKRIRLIIDLLEGLVQDIENFSVLGVKVVPRTLVVPLRNLMDELQSAYSGIDDFIDDVLGFFENLVEECERINNG